MSIYNHGIIYTRTFLVRTLLGFFTSFTIFYSGFNWGLPSKLSSNHHFQNVCHFSTNNLPLLHTGHLHLSCQGEGHWSQAEAGDRRLEQPGVHVRPVQEQGRVTSPRWHNQRDCLPYGRFAHGSQLSHEQQVNLGHHMCYTCISCKSEIWLFKICDKMEIRVCKMKVKVNLRFLKFLKMHPANVFFCHVAVDIHVLTTNYLNSDT